MTVQNEEAGTWRCSVKELITAVKGDLLSEPHSEFFGVSTDSRGDLSGKMFIALKGDKFNGHDYVVAAVQSGARVVLVHETRSEWQPLYSKATFVQVKDTLTGLQSLATFWRRKHQFKVVAITGSNGKTSTKEFTSSLFRPHFRTFASKGSFNNHWGVPLSILAAGPDCTHLVLEMGMNHVGEIWRLCLIAEPDICVVTTVGRAHVGEVGSQEKIAQAKEEIYLACPKAIHIFNLDNEWTMRMFTRSHSQRIGFSSFKPDAEVSLRAEKMDWDGLEVSGVIGGVAGRVKVKVFGRQNVVNLMATASLGLACNLKPEQIWQGLSEIRDVAWGRNQLLELTNGARVLFDGYNANPDSMQALIKNMYEMEVVGKKYLVAGDMLELGEQSGPMHEQIGAQAAGLHAAGIWFVGKCADAFWRGFKSDAQTSTETFSSVNVDAEISKQLLERLQPGDLVAIKGSRGVGLEKVLDQWPLVKPLGGKP